MTVRRLWPLVFGLVAGCGGTSDGSGAPDVATAEDSVALAAAQFDPSAFDTVTWETPEAAHERGAVVFSYSCSKCHGSRGFGDAGFVSRGDTLKPPSFHQANWRFTDDLEGLRLQIYTGRPGGMPHWGLEGLKYKDIDAVARYILEVLR